MITAELELNGSSNDVVSSIASDVAVNNVSKAMVWGNTTKNNGYQGITLGSGKISFANGYVGGGIGNLQSYRGYNGYMWGAADNDGKYSLELTFVGTNIDSITFYFDKTAQQYATIAILDEGTANEQTIESDDYVLSVMFAEPAASHTIKFTDWSLPNYNVCITHIEIMLNKLVFDRRWIKEVTSTAQSQPEQQEPYFGILPNNGNLQLYDVDGELMDYAKDGILTNSEYSVKIFANGKQLQYHITNETYYNLESKTIELELTNTLNKWSELNFNGMPLQTEEKSAYFVLSYILDGLGYSSAEIATMCDKTIVTGDSSGYAEKTVKQYLESILIPYPYLSQSTYREAIEKICQIGQLQCYADDNNSIKFISARPLATAAEKAATIVIPAKAQASQLQQSLFLKNNYDKTRMSVNECSLQRVNLGQINFNGYTYDNENALATTFTNLNDYDLTLSEEFGSYTAGMVIYTRFKYAVFNVYINGDIITAYQQLKGTFSMLNHRTDYFSPYKSEKNNYNGVLGETDSAIDVYDTESDFDAVSPTSPTYNAIYVGIIKNDSTKNKIKIRIKLWYNLLLYLDELDIEGTKLSEFYNINTQINTSLEAIKTENIIIENGSTSKNIYTFTENELLQSGTHIGEEVIINILSANLLSDYAGGVVTAKQSLICIDLKNSVGATVKDFERNGELLQINEVIKPLKKDGTALAFANHGVAKLFKVTSRAFFKVGYPRKTIFVTEIKNLNT